MPKERVDIHSNMYLCGEHLGVEVIDLVTTRKLATISPEEKYSQYCNYETCTNRPIQKFAIMFPAAMEVKS